MISNLQQIDTIHQFEEGKLKLDSIGAITRDVTAKIWDDKVDVIDNGKVVEEEGKFLSRMKYDLNLAKSICFCSNGYCSGGPMNGVVYDLSPLDSLFNHTSKVPIGPVFGSLPFSKPVLQVLLKGRHEKKMVMERYVFIWSDSARLIAKRVYLKEDVVKFKYKTLDEWVYRAHEPQRSIVHASLMKGKD
ncbi:hypothetical protein LguiA_030235 [Lonicera macranthoides]